MTLEHQKEYFQLLRSENPLDRNKAIALLEKSNSSVLADTLPDLLENPKETFLNRVLVLDTLSRIGHYETIQRLTSFIEKKSSDPTMDLMVFYTLETLIGKNLHAIENKLQNPHIKTIKFYIALSGKNKRKAAVPLLVNQLQAINRESSMLSVLVDALGDIGCETAAQPLLKTLHACDDLTRCQVVNALGKIGSPSPLPEIIDLIGKSDILDLTVIKALSQIGGKEATQAIIRFISNDIPVLRNNALDGLIKIGKESIQYLYPLLEDSDSDIRILTLNVLGMINERKVLSKVMPLCRDDHPNVRVAAFGVFEKVGLPANRFILIRGFADEEKEVRYAALSALEKFPIETIIDTIMQAAKRDLKVKDFFIEAVINLTAVNIFKLLHKNLEFKELLYQRLAGLRQTNIFDDFKKALLQEEDSIFSSEFDHTLTKTEMHVSRFHILHVEDTAFIQRLVSSELQKMGYRVTSANDGQDGLEKFDENMEFDLVLTDINMPRKDGIQFIKEIRKNELFHSLPIIVNSTESQEIDIKIAIKAGANDYIVKPIDFDKMAMLLENLLQKMGYKESGSFLKNRRHSLRKNISMPVSGRVNNQLLYGKCINMNEGGMLIKVNLPLTHDTSFLIRFQLKQGDKATSIKMPCRVVWSKNGIAKEVYNTGIRFDELNSQFAQTIKSVMQEGTNH